MLPCFHLLQVRGVKMKLSSFALSFFLSPRATCTASVRISYHIRRYVRLCVCLCVRGRKKGREKSIFSFLFSFSPSCIRQLSCFSISTIPSCPVLFRSVVLRCAECRIPTPRKGRRKQGKRWVCWLGLQMQGKKRKEEKAHFASSLYSENRKL